MFHQLNKPVAGDMIATVKTNIFSKQINLIKEIEDTVTIEDNVKEEMEEQKEVYEEQIRDCYTPKSSYDFYGVSEDMFH